MTKDPLQAVIDAAIDLAEAVADYCDPLKTNKVVMDALVAFDTACTAYAANVPLPSTTRTPRVRRRD